MIYSWGELLSNGLITVSDDIITKVNTNINGYELIMNDNITTIGAYAFDDCYGLKKVTFCDGLTTIGNYAFQNCDGLISLYFPGSTTNLGTKCFYLCSKISYINVAAGNTSYTSYDGVMYTKNMTAVYLCPNGRTTGVTVPEGVTTILASSFSTCRNIPFINLPSTLEVIEQKEFKNCTSLKELVIPDSVTSISDTETFYNIVHVVYNGSIPYKSSWGAKTFN